MRLGISGSHATGKSTLMAELGAGLPNYSLVDEAYFHLIEEGHGFGAAPTVEEVATQLRRSIHLIENVSDPDTIFERCPVDYVAYLIALHTDSETLRNWVDEARDALATLDAVIFVPVEPRDRISVSREDLPKLRRAVDRALRDLLIDDSWGLNLTVRECRGSIAERVRQVLSWIGAPESRVT